MVDHLNLASVATVTIIFAKFLTHPAILIFRCLFWWAGKKANDRLTEEDFAAAVG
jgi:hypothetical protein